MTDELLTVTVWKSGTPMPDVAGDVYSSNRICYRGEVLHLTPEQVAMTFDRNGHSYLDLSEAEQEERWGEIRFRRGDHSAEVPYIGSDDSTVRYRRRENALLAAQKIADAAERKKAFEDIDRLYGRADSGQRTLRRY